MTIYGRSGELVSRCVECDVAEPESLASLGGSAPGLVEAILSMIQDHLSSNWERSMPSMRAVLEPRYIRRGANIPALTTRWSKLLGDEW